MRISRIRLPAKIEYKIWQKHNVIDGEVEEVLLGRPHIRFIEEGHRKGEDVYAAYGRTLSGRYLIVFFILKSGPEALVISARNMTKKERRRYNERGAI